LRHQLLALALRSLQVAWSSGTEYSVAIAPSAFASPFV
jgi:hypothetical protein